MSSEDFKIRLAAGAKRAGLTESSLSQLTSGASTAEEVVRVMDAFFLSVQPEAFEEWVDTPVPALEGSTPKHLIRVGRAKEVCDCLFNLADGNPA